MPEAGVHRSLIRQLRKLGLSPAITPDERQWQAVLKVISDSYTDADADRYTLERSIEIASEEMRALHDVLSGQARHDSLTGLPNRAALCGLLDDSLIGIADRANLAVLFIDLDGFKRVNDTLGHTAGDEVLVRASERIRAAVRAEDFVARLGGDEFVVCCRDVDEPAVIDSIARRIVEHLETPFRIAGQNTSIGASVGIAYAKNPGSDARPVSDSEELLSRADLAMYQAKTTGRSRHVTFDERMGALAEERLATETALGLAVHRDELVLHYQPIIDLSDHSMVAMEALVRWNRPSHGLQLPDTFIPIAESSKLISAIDSWVLRHACVEAASWPDERVSVSVNLSARDLQQDEIVAAVSNALHGSGLAPGRLIIELTETALMSDDPAASANLSRIESLGVGLAIDDFGTGYSSLSYLRQLTTGSIKIDRSFITSIADDEVAAAIVGAIITMAHSVGQRVVAEGVESNRQAQRLRLLGCDAAQGFLFARPQLGNQTSKLFQDYPAQAFGT